MNTVKKYKIVSYACLVLLTAIFIMLTIHLKNQNNLNAWSLVFIILGVLTLSVILFTINYLTGNKFEQYYYNKFRLSQITDKHDEQEKEEEEEEETELTKQLTFNDLKDKLLPKSNFKFLDSYAKKLLINLGKNLEIVQGALYFNDPETQNTYKLVAQYATVNKGPEKLTEGEGLVGQAIKDRKNMIINEVPENYLVESGLGKSVAGQIIILPLVTENKVVAALELASFKPLDNNIIQILDELKNNLTETLQNFNIR